MIKKGDKVIFVKDTKEHSKGEIHDVVIHNDSFFIIKEELEMFNSSQRTNITYYEKKSPVIMTLADWREQQIKIVLDD
jgi:hypothetical protein